MNEYGICLCEVEIPILRGGFDNVGSFCQHEVETHGFRIAVQREVYGDFPVVIVNNDLFRLQFTFDLNFLDQFREVVHILTPVLLVTGGQKDQSCQ